MTDLDVKGLVDRLQAYRSRNEWGDAEHHSICDEAATALLSLSEQIEVLTFERDNLVAWFDGLTPAEMHDVIVKWKSTAEAAEQRLQKLEEALNHIASWTQTEGLLWWQQSAREALKEQP